MRACVCLCSCVCACKKKTYLALCQQKILFLLLCILENIYLAGFYSNLTYDNYILTLKLVSLAINDQMSSLSTACRRSFRNLLCTPPGVTAITDGNTTESATRLVRCNQHLLVQVSDVPSVTRLKERITLTSARLIGHATVTSLWSNLSL